MDSIYTPFVSENGITNENSPVFILMNDESNINYMKIYEANKDQKNNYYEFLKGGKNLHPLKIGILEYFNNNYVSIGVIKKGDIEEAYLSNNIKSLECYKKNLKYYAILSILDNIITVIWGVLIIIFLLFVLYVWVINGPS